MVVKQLLNLVQLENTTKKDSTTKTTKTTKTTMGPIVDNDKDIVNELHGELASKYSTTEGRITIESNID